MSVCPPPNARWCLGPGVRRENEGVGKRGPRGRGGAAAAGTDLSAVGSPPARCSGSLEKQHPPCRRVLGGPMSFWPPPSARWSLGPGVRRENEGVGKRGPRGRGGAAVTVRTSAQ